MNKGKITSRQAMILFLITVFPSMLWAMPTTIVLESKQAGWLAPIPGFLLLLFFIKQLNYLIVNNPNLSLMQIFEKATNKIIGKLYAIILLVLHFYLSSITLRYLSEQMLSSIFPYVQSDLLIISVLIIVNIILKTNITILARMSEMMLFLLIGIIMVLIFLLLPNISIVNITPISRLDIIPIIKSGTMNFFSPLSLYFLLLLVSSDCIVNKKNFINYSKKITIIILFIETLLLISAIGTFGYYFLQNTPYGYITLIKHIEILNFLKGFDSLFIIIWVVSEFITLTIVIFYFIKLLEYIFNIKHINNFINVITILYFVFSKLIAKNIYIMEIYLEYSLLIFVITIFIPMLMVLIYRIRFRKKQH